MRQMPAKDSPSLMQPVSADAPIGITITIPIYNEEDDILLLYERLCAALERSGRVWEVVLVDDGSTDRSPALLDDLAARDKRIVVVHFRRNYGQTAAFMAGLDHARGQIVVP